MDIRSLEDLKCFFDENKDLKYKKFTDALVPNIAPENIIGVKIPIIRKAAKNITAKNKNFYYDILKNKEEFLFEEKILCGIIIGYLNLEFSELKKEMEWFIPLIDNWSVCDTFCCGLKCFLKFEDEGWSFIEYYLKSGNEYFIRFGFVIILRYYVKKDYLERIFNFLRKFNSELYYAEMAAAWALSVCYTNFPDETYLFMREENIGDSLKNKTVRKVLDSNKISEYNKNIIRTLIKKK